MDSLGSLSPHQLRQLNVPASGLAQKNEVHALVALQVEQSALAPDVVLVSDVASAYKTAVKALWVVGRQIPSGTHKLGSYHIQNVNALHSRIKAWFGPFKGVATKHLPVYLARFRFFDETGWVRAPGEFLRDAIYIQTVRYECQSADGPKVITAALLTGFAHAEKAWKNSQTSPERGILKKKLCLREYSRPFLSAERRMFA